MRTTIKAGVKGWFERQHEGADVAEFGQETVVALRESDNPYWLITEGPVSGFPGAPRIFISKSDVEEEQL